KGLEQLREAIAMAAAGPAPSRYPLFPESFEQETAALGEAVGDGMPNFLLRRLLLDVGGYTEKHFAEQPCEKHLINGDQPGDFETLLHKARQRLAEAGCPVPAIEPKTRYAWIREVTAGCIRRPIQRLITWTDRLDRILTHKVWGTVVFLALMFVVFQSIFTWATPIMDLIKSGKDLLRG